MIQCVTSLENLFGDGEIRANENVEMTFGSVWNLMLVHAEDCTPPRKTLSTCFCALRLSCFAARCR